jgi:ABC-type transporter Mla subunit MlaD
LKVQRTDFYVGIFVIATIVTVLAAIVATSGIGIKRYDLYIRGDDATSIAVDTKIFLQGLEVGRVTVINAVPGTKSGRLEFVIRASMLANLSDGRPLRLPDSTEAEVVTTILGSSTLNLVARGSSRDTLQPGDTIRLVRAPEAMQAIGHLATDLKDQIANALVATTDALHAVRRLADSATVATGTARRFVAGIQAPTEQTLQEAAANLERMRRLMDTTDVRTGVTMRQLDATMTQTRQLMASADSLTRLVTAMGLESRPEVREMMANLQFLTEQMLYVTEQIARRPTRAMTGVELPDTLTVEGRARQLAADSARMRAAHDSTHTPRDTTRSPSP